MNKTKIEWADMTWNPVSGCLTGCEYCYARSIANRFKGGGYGKQMGMIFAKYKDDVFKPPYVLEEQHYARTKDNWYRIAPYPFGFAPTFHKYRLNEPQNVKKPQNIFVCSMADLFGDWVPDEWIDEVFEACHKAPQHNYLFLTKNPKRYKQFEPNYFSNMWLGISYTHLTDGIIPGAKEFIKNHNNNLFMSLEPILEPLHFGVVRNYIKWAIIGAETGNRKNKVIPKKEWIDSIIEQCKKYGIPVFMKDSLIPIMGEKNMLREFPKELRKGICK